MARHRRIVTGQRVSAAKVVRSRALRHDATHAEQLLWERLRHRRLDGWKFRRQQIIAGFIVDFYCDLAGLVVEVDGPIHHFRKAYDAARDQILCSHNLRILRVTNHDVEGSIERVLLSIRNHLDLTPQPPLLQGEGESRSDGGEVS